MARPLKPGLDYFALDTSALSDPKLIAARRDYGYLAIIVYLQLLCIIYRDKGYYLQYNDETKDEVISSIISEVLIGKYQPDYKTIEDLIGKLVACRLFSHDLYQLGYITSHRIQKIYYKATVERRSVSVDPAIWLLSFDEMMELSSKHSLLSKIINRSNNSINQSNNQVNQSNNTQRKGKEKKVKDSKVNGKESNPEPWDRVYEKFFNLFGKEPDESFQRSVKTTGKTVEQCLSAMAAASKRDPENPEAYILSTIRRYDTDHTIAHRLGIDQQEPTGELEDWEKDWLREIGKL